MPALISRLFPSLVVFINPRLIFRFDFYLSLGSRAGQDWSLIVWAEPGTLYVLDNSRGGVLPVPPAPLPAQSYPHSVLPNKNLVRQENIF